MSAVYYKKPSRAIWVGQYYYRSGKRTKTPPSWRNRRTGEIRKLPPQEIPRMPQKINPQAEKRFANILSRSPPETSREIRKKHSYSYDKFLIRRNPE
jgi:hypothetical protein